MASELEAEIWGEEEEDPLIKELASMSTEEIRQRARYIQNEVGFMKREMDRIKNEAKTQAVRIKDNKEKVKLNKQLPYLVANIVEIVEPYVDVDEDGSAGDSNADYKGKGVVVKTSTRQTVFLPIPGLVRAEEVVPGELVGVNKDSYIVLEKLPAEFDSRTKAMEVDDRPTEDYTDIGGLDKQIQELIEAIVLPMTHSEKFEAIGIRAPKGVLLYGPPGCSPCILYLFGQ